MSDDHDLEKLAELFKQIGFSVIPINKPNNEDKDSPPSIPQPPPIPLQVPADFDKEKANDTLEKIRIESATNLNILGDVLSSIYGMLRRSHNCIPKIAQEQTEAAIGLLVGALKDLSQFDAELNKAKEKLDAVNIGPVVPTSPPIPDPPLKAGSPSNDEEESVTESGLTFIKDLPDDEDMAETQFESNQIMNPTDPDQDSTGLNVTCVPLINSFNSIEGVVVVYFDGSHRVVARVVPRK